MSSHIHAKVLAQSIQTALETAADGIELPLTVVTIQLTDNHGCFDGEG